MSPQTTLKEELERGGVVSESVAIVAAKTSEANKVAKLEESITTFSGVVIKLLRP